MTIIQYIGNIANNFKRGIAIPYNISESGLIINPEIKSQVSKKTGLAFVDEEETARPGEVCFAASPEVRPEFRSTFTSKDILHYAYAILYSSVYHRNFDSYLKKGLEGIHITTDAILFWELVMLGSELKKNHCLENPLTDFSVAKAESEKIIKKIDTLLSN